MSTRDDLPLPSRMLAAFSRGLDGFWPFLDRQIAARPRPLRPGIFTTLSEAAAALLAYKPELRARLRNQPERFLHLANSAVVLGSWRLGQDIYRFDPDFYQAVVASTGIDEVPTDALHRLPSWGHYVEAPGIEFDGLAFDGFFANTSYDAGKIYGLPPSDQIQITFVADRRDDSGAFAEIGIVLDLGSDLRASMASLVADYNRLAANEPRERTHTGDAWGEQNLPSVRKAIALLLYISSAPPEEDFPPARRPVGKRVKGVLRHFPADRVSVWDVGTRVGAALRAAQASAQGGTSAGGGPGKRPHLRAAHFHSYWTGPRDGVRERRVRWLPPIFVRKDLADPARTPAVIHPVQAGRHALPASAESDAAR